MNPYFEQMVLSASPIELVRLLYQKAIASVREAREHLGAGRIAERCASINSAYAVLLELTGSLKDDDSPELAARLKGLYGYMQQRLVDANANQTDEPLSEILGLLTTLAEAWNSVPDSSHEASGETDHWEASLDSGAELAARYAVSA